MIFLYYTVYCTSVEVIQFVIFVLLLEGFNCLNALIISYASVEVFKFNKREVFEFTINNTIHYTYTLSVYITSFMKVASYAPQSLFDHKYINIINIAKMLNNFIF